ncbi:hypothetical protein HBI12_054130 [Parastagonospora nodorum]|nr:hypothetical protein HBI12_054130 [Parastagonospora nodorum]KAH5433812.1 hypothetical protein HBI47_087470 [Parastagonospora nodorum]
MTHSQLSKLLGGPKTGQATAWKTGFLRRLPWLAILGLASTLVASAFMVGILTSSNDSPIHSWAYQPTVLLAITYTIANICLQYALGQAITVAWWRKALRGDATVRELHSTWAFGNGLKDILLSGRSFNFVAFTGLLVTFAPVNGPLLQRASVIGSRGGFDLVNVTIPIAQKIPLGYTGAITGREHVTTTLSNEFRSIINRQNSQDMINITNSGCLGTCKGHVLGAGYDVQCNEWLTPYDLHDLFANGSRRDARLDCFQTYFSYYEMPGIPNMINYTTGFKVNETYEGNMTWRTCTLAPAVVEYPIILKNDTISLDPEGSWMTDRVTEHWPDPFSPSWVGVMPSTHGGLWLYLRSLYSSSVNTWYSGPPGWASQFQGTTALRYVNSSGQFGGPFMNFFDPTPDIMSDAREIAFRIALDIPNQGGKPQDYLKTIEVQQLWSQIVYKSQYIYLAVAVAITVLASLSVFGLLLGWWKLGRKVTLSPIEVAKAFAAPSLHDALSNTDIKALLKTTGHRRLRYGAVWDDIEVDEHSEATLHFARNGRCERPHEGQILR